MRSLRLRRRDRAGVTQRGTSRVRVTDVVISPTSRRGIVVVRRTARTSSSSSASRARQTLPTTRSCHTESNAERRRGPRELVASTFGIPSADGHRWWRALPRPSPHHPTHAERHPPTLDRPSRPFNTNSHPRCLAIRRPADSASNRVRNVEIGRFAPWSATSHPSERVAGRTSIDIPASPASAVGRRRGGMPGRVT